MQTSGALKTGLLIAGGLLAYNAFAKVKTLRTLNFYPKKIDSIRWENANPVIRFGLAVQNTSGQKIVVKSLAANLFTNDILIGNVGLFTPIAILPNSETILWLSVRLSLIGAVQDIIRAFNLNGISQKMALIGNVNVDNYQLPLIINYKIGK